MKNDCFSIFGSAMKCNLGRRRTKDLLNLCHAPNDPNRWISRMIPGGNSRTLTALEPEPGSSHSSRDELEGSLLSCFSCWIRRRINSRKAASRSKSSSSPSWSSSSWTDHDYQTHSVQRDHPGTHLTRYVIFVRCNNIQISDFFLDRQEVIIDVQRGCFKTIV